MVTSDRGCYPSRVKSPLSKHRLAEERSLAYHRAVARELLRDPSLLEIARARADAWITEGKRSAPYALEWKKILDLPVRDVAAFLVERSERAATLRQSTPFAGMISAQERWQIWKDVRADFEVQPGTART